MYLDNIKRTFPTKLYKYKQGEEYDILNLESDDLLFRNPLEFNDPYDSLININTIKVRNLMVENSAQIGISDFRVLFSNIFKPWFDEFQEQLDKATEGLKMDLRVACFSECNDSILMWSHYANYHKGFCVEYNYEELNTYFEPYGGINPVKYINNIEAFGDEYIIELLKINSNIEYNTINEEIVDNAGKLFCEDSRDNEKMIKKCMRNSNLQGFEETMHYIKKAFNILNKYADYEMMKLPLFKFDDWEYEKEWRVILGKDSNLLQRDKKLNIRDMKQQDKDNQVIPIFVKIPKPTAIYLGCKAESHLEDQLKGLCSNLEIPLYKMKLNESKFKLEPKKIYDPMKDRI